ncbi:translation termination factor GTPase eRF3, partial [Bonamia ostreae]
FLNFSNLDISNLPMSGLTGDGIINPPSEKICDWSEGKTLLSLLDNQKITRPKNSAVRLPVISRYNEMGTVVALGKIESGVLLAGAKLKLSPSGKEVVCDSIFVSEEKVDAARSGENVNVYLKNCEKEDIFCGDIICGIDDIAPKSNFLECQIYVTDLLKHKPVISVGYSCIFHAHSTTSQCEFLRLGQIDQNKKMKKIQFAKEKSAIFCKLKLSKQIAIEKYSDFAQLGRFTLRDEGKTIAIGRVLKLLE